MIEQVGIIIFSCTSVYLFSTKDYYKYGFVVGLLGQPLWIHTSFANEQWGIFIVSLWFTFAHLKGLKTHWRK